MNSSLPDQPFRTSDLQAHGLTRADLRDGLSDGSLRTLFRGVVTPSHLPDSIELRARALSMVVNPDHVLCDRTAAWLHGVDVLLLTEHEVAPPVEVCALRGQEPSDRSGTRGCVRDLPADDITEIEGLRVTTPLRTALDLGCNLKRRDAFAALVEFCRRHGITGEQLRPRLRGFRGRRGVVQLRALIPLIDPRLESVREAWTFLEIHDEGLPLPRPQWTVRVDDATAYRLDLAYPLARVAVEYDGVEWHLATPEQRRHDEQRRARLRELGWTVIVVRSGDFSGVRRDRWVAALRTALRPSYSNKRFA